MGELVSRAERSALAPRARESAKHGYGPKTSKAFDMGKRFGERAIMGRYYVGLGNTGPQMGSHIMRGMLRASQMRFNPMRFTDAFGIARMILGNLTTVAGPAYSTSANCGGAPTHVSGLVNWSHCGIPEWVVANRDMGRSLNARTVCTWKYLRPYGPNPDFSYFAPVEKWTKPLGFGTQTVNVPLRDVPVPLTDLPTPAPGQAMSWAPGFNAPVSHPAFNTPAETYYHTGAPWEVDNATKAVTATLPLPSVQVITPTPTPPTLTGTKPGPSRGPGRRVKERKFAGKKIMLRLLRLGLAVTEGLDALDAVYDAIPQDKKKACRKAARDRYWANKKSGAGWGTVNWQLLPQEKAACIYANLDYLDINHVFYNLIKNQIEDLWAGWQYAAIDGGLQKGRHLGGPVVTKNPYQHSPLELPEWDDPFWDEVQDYMESKGI